jgi:hypothetical protein
MHVTAPLVTGTEIAQIAVEACEHNRQLLIAERARQEDDLLSLLAVRRDGPGVGLADIILVDALGWR